MEKRIILHSHGVAEYMYRNAKYNRELMFVLGLLHDLGKLNGFEKHEVYGAEILKNVGFIYAKEIQYHGKVQEEYTSYELDLLNAADLSVDRMGNEIGYKKRIKEIGEYYGEESKEYKDAVILAKQLMEKGFLEIKEGETEKKS